MEQSRIDKSFFAQHFHVQVACNPLWRAQVPCHTLWKVTKQLEVHFFTTTCGSTKRGWCAQEDDRGKVQFVRARARWQPKSCTHTWTRSSINSDCCSVGRHASPGAAATNILAAATCSSLIRNHFTCQRLPVHHSSLEFNGCVRSHVLIIHHWSLIIIEESAVHSTSSLHIIRVQFSDQNPHFKHPTLDWMLSS